MCKGCIWVACALLLCAAVAAAVLVRGLSPVYTLPTGAAYRLMHADGYDGTKPLPTVLIVHGWGGNVFRASSIYGRLASELRREGYHTLELSLRGHARAEGTVDAVSRADHADDIRAAVALLKQKREVDASKLAAYGMSYGAYMLAVLSAELDLKLLALHVPALYSDAGWDEPSVRVTDDPQRVAWRSRVRTGNDSAALANLQRFQGSMLLVTSGHDEDMPREVTQSYLTAAFPAREVVHVELPGAPHYLVRAADKKKFFELTRAWFKAHYKTP